MVVIVVLETGTENSQKGNQDAGWEKVKNVKSENEKKNCVAKGLD